MYRLLMLGQLPEAHTGTLVKIIGLFLVPQSKAPLQPFGKQLQSSFRIGIGPAAQNRPNVAQVALISVSLAVEGIGALLRLSQISAVQRIL